MDPSCPLVRSSEDRCDRRHRETGGAASGAEVGEVARNSRLRNHGRLGDRTAACRCTRPPDLRQTSTGRPDGIPHELCRPRGRNRYRPERNRHQATESCPARAEADAPIAEPLGRSREAPAASVDETPRPEKGAAGATGRPDLRPSGDHAHTTTVPTSAVGTVVLRRVGSLRCRSRSANAHPGHR